MNWKSVKQFLKPTWMKILLNLILWILMFTFQDYINSTFLIYILGIPFYIVNHFLWNPFVYLHDITMETKSQLLALSSLLLLFFVVFIFLIYYYLICCLIVWFYNKIRGKKRHKKSKFHINFNSEWKKFFKPNLRKIIVFIILILIESLLVYFNILYIGNFIFISIPFLFALFLENKIIILCAIMPLIGILFLIVNLYLLSLLINLIYLYFISCVIINFYDRIKLKNLE